MQHPGLDSEPGNHHRVAHPPPHEGGPSMALTISKNRFFDIPDDVLESYELKGDAARQAEQAFEEDMKTAKAGGDSEAYGTTWSDQRRCSYKYN